MAKYGSALTVLALGVTLSSCTSRSMNTGAEPFVVGGFKVDAQSKENFILQSTVALTTKTLAADNHSFCSGTLISPNKVLTAAHCVSDSSGKPILKDEVFVVQGSQVSKDARMIKVIKSVPHELYDSANTVTMAPRVAPNDIAVIFLQEPITTPFKEIRPNTAKLTIGTPVYIAGYGVTFASTGNDTGTLRAVNLPISSVDTDYRRFKTQASYKGSCSGDSGGPIYIQDSSGAWSVAGVVSAGAQINILGNPICSGTNVYTDVSHYGDWIARQTPPSAPNVQSVSVGCAGDFSCMSLKGQQFDGQSVVEILSDCSQNRPISQYLAKDFKTLKTDTIDLVMDGTTSASLNGSGSIGVRVLDTRLGIRSACLLAQRSKEPSCADFGPATGPNACLVFFVEDFRGQCERMNLIKMLRANVDLSKDPSYYGQAWRLAQTLPNGGGVVAAGQKAPPVFFNTGVGPQWRTNNAGVLAGLSCPQ